LRTEEKKKLKSTRETYEALKVQERRAGKGEEYS